MNLSRRDVLRTSAAATAAIAFGTVANAQEAVEPVSVCVMGVNGRGQAHAHAYAGIKGAQVKYICDVDSNVANKCAADIEKRTGKKPQVLSDIRKALDDQALTAISIAAPDHWHAPATILALKAGKHVYCEKPCSHNAHEAELMMEAAKKYNRQVQIGTQRRSTPGFIKAVQLLHDGALGKLTLARTWYTAARGSIGHGKAVPVPGFLNWELWQGPAPEKEFHDNYVHYKWHWFWHWGTGELGNNGVHMLDLCRWGLGVDYPRKVTSMGGRYSFDDDQQTPDVNVVTYDFGDKLITWECRSCQPRGYEGNEGVGVEFYGPKGTLVMEDKNWTLYDNKNKVLKQEKTGFMDPPHFQNFVDAIRGQAKLTCPVEDGAHSTLLCHYGNIAWKLGRTVELDPQTHQPADKEAQGLWTREYRDGWAPTV